MKTLATSLVFMCALTMLAASALGQITISAADVDATLAVGDSIANRIDKVTQLLDVGLHGPTSWDFSALRWDSSQTLMSVTVAGAPFAGQFPGATHLFKTDLNISYPSLSPTPIPATAYIYFQRSATGLANLGEGANGTGPTWTGVSALITNIPANLFYKLPLTYGTTWTSVYLDTTVIQIPPFAFPGPAARHTTSYVVDAYGPMTLPGGSVHDALRIKQTDTSSSVVVVSYTFLARDGASVQATAGLPSEPDSGIIPIRPTASWNGQMIALPIQLVSFNASQNPSGGGVLLRWSTLSETNNYGFEVQRGAQPGGDFVTVSGAFIPGHGTTTVPRDYSYADMSAPSGAWYYRLKQIDLGGTIHYSDPEKVDVRAEGTGRDVPVAFSLGQNFPNPFNPETTIRYGLPSRSHVVLAVYNMLGERVAVLVEGEQESGIHEVRFDGSSLSSGVYFYRLQSAGHEQTKKLSLLR